MPDFADRLALVTGAASGIGYATARGLAAAGSRLILVDRNEHGLSEAAGRLGSAVTAAQPGNVEDEAMWDTLAPALENLSFAVINAGVSGASPIKDLEFAEWRRILSVNLDGAFLTLRAAMRAMHQSGSIVVTASASGLKAEQGIAAYGASKAALIHLVRIAAKEGAAQQIRVNAIAPGGVETPIWREVPFFNDLVASEGSEQGAFDAMAKLATPLGRYARDDEIAEQILFLLSQSAATITGATLASDGGYTL